MKTKSAAKRQAIVTVATEVFREYGFERASMSEILARVGGSKATLYNHFASKEALFLEVAFPAIEAENNAVMDVLDATGREVGELLQEFGEKAMTLSYSPDVMAARRLTIAEAHRFNIGPMGYQLGYVPSVDRIAAFLAKAMQQGQLREADPHLATLHLAALLEAELLQRFLYHVMTPEDTLAIPAMVRRALAVFMAAYGPHPQ